MATPTLFCSLQKLLQTNTFMVKFIDHGRNPFFKSICLSANVHDRVRDWIHGVRAAAPPKETRDALDAEPLYKAERLRIIYQLITNPISEGGAGITPKEGEWKNVESIFALHDHAYNKDWIRKWTSSYFLKTEDLDEIRNRLGEKVGFGGS